MKSPASRPEPAPAPPADRTLETGARVSVRARDAVSFGQNRATVLHLRGDERAKFALVEMDHGGRWWVRVSQVNPLERPDDLYERWRADPTAWWAAVSVKPRLELLSTLGRIGSSCDTAMELDRGISFDGYAGRYFGLLEPMDTPQIVSVVVRVLERLGLPERRAELRLSPRGDAFGPRDPWSSLLRPREIARRVLSQLLFALISRPDPNRSLAAVLDPRLLLRLRAVLRTWASAEEGDFAARLLLASIEEPLPATLADLRAPDRGCYDRAEEAGLGRTFPLSGA